MISRSVPHTPIASPSTSSSPSRGAGSGSSATPAESGRGGWTVNARMLLRSVPVRSVPVRSVSGTPQALLVPLLGRALRTGRQVAGRVDQGHVAERLGEVAHQPARLRVVL